MIHPVVLLVGSPLESGLLFFDHLGTELIASMQIPTQPVACLGKDKPQLSECLNLQKRKTFK